MKKRLQWLRYLFLLLAFASATVVSAQEVTVTGKVTDAADGSSLPGVTVVIKNTTLGTVTDIDGKYSVKVNPGAILVFSYVGYQTQEVTFAGQKTINIELSGSVSSLSELVVIGYGTVKKQDATGSVVAIDDKDYNKGAISSPQQLIIGKIPGVQVTTLGGAPGGDAQIRIRGGSSLNASNDPLIVIDGIPIDNAATSGARGSLSMINPDDIATTTVLKDASATAIYGSRASNGVILITTKKGAAGKKFGVDYSGNVSIATVPKTISVLTGDEFTALVKERYPNRPDVTGLLGTSNTDWQKEIYRTGISTDHNIALNGTVSTMPYRLSLGYLYQDGILKTDNMKRTSVGLNLNPTFFKNYLKLNVNAKYIFEKNHFADNAAIGAAIAFDPTQPVNEFRNLGQHYYGGYWAWLQSADTLPVNQATTNPAAYLNLKEDDSKVNRFLGNAQIDYKLHFFPDLRAVLNLGIDYVKGKGTVYIPEYATWTFTDKGQDNTYYQIKNNKVLDFYLNYVKDVKSIYSKFDVMAGYSWQHFYYEANDYKSNVPHDTARTTDITKKKEYYLVSFYGRFNYTLLDRYLLTFTLRDDGSSKFSKNTRWGLFPSAALAWKINEEAFLRDSKVLSQLKLRLGWGKTGQQDITDNWYPYQSVYTASDQYAQYQFGNVWYTTWRANSYDPDIKWETTTTWNVGLDFGFLQDRITGSIDYYIRNTYDLLNYAPVPAGTNLSNYVWTNIGDMTNKGWEFAIDAKPIVTKDWKWDINVNFTYNKNEITKLSLTDDPSYLGVTAGGISGGVGNTVQMQSVGYPMYSFFVYQQVYDNDGNPIEGLYVDRNNDGKIDDHDRYHYKSANPDATIGFATTLSWKKLSFSAAGHAAIGNYVYNNISSNRGVYSNLYRPEGPYLGNVTSDVNDTKFVNNQYLSDYYVQNGSFFKMDYMSLSYDFGNLVKNTLRLGISFTVNNVFTITKYKGLDPELASSDNNRNYTVGIDNNMYPRSRVFVLGVNLSL
ncbi:MAG: TonB-dependent receptor [Bacteroidales bacterium]|nr:TonB-dependent receptor [Bacteroidales bacterium]NCA76173.1 TonB-dependent receptor [Alphaproteobacteria bacterium]HNW73129.1 TonB-dependent receptor [Bacteroidales bacterium]HPS49806.1 TonB-dependent receptor [Bacteroidales bacterium]